MDARRETVLLAILKRIGSVRIAVVLLSLTAAACLLGTLMPQRTANIAVYHAPWFLLLLAMLALNLTACTLSRYRAWRRRWGFLAVHASIILIVAGALIDGIWGKRGMMVLRPGDSSSSYGTGENVRELPFVLRLAEFRVERHPAEVGLSIVDGGTPSPDHTGISEGDLCSLPDGGALRVEAVVSDVQLQQGLRPAPAAGAGGVGVQVLLSDSHGALGTGVLLEGTAERLAAPRNVLRVVLLVTEDAAALDRVLAGIVLPTGNGRVRIDQGEAGAASVDASPGLEATLPGGGTVRVLRFLPHFRLGPDGAENVSERSENPAVQIEVIRPNTEPETMWLFSKFPAFNGMHGRDTGLSAVFLRPEELDYDCNLYLLVTRTGDARYAVMDGRGQVRRGELEAGSELDLGTQALKLKVEKVLLDAVAVDEVTHAPTGQGRVAVKLQRLSPAGRTVGDPLWAVEGNAPARLADSRVRVAVSELRGRIRDFKSTLQVLDGGSVVREQVVEVNHPLVHGGYTVYQSSYDSEHESWSGLEVAKAPGVPLVYAGFTVFVCGLVAALYVQPLLRRRMDEAQSGAKT